MRTITKARVDKTLVSPEFHDDTLHYRRHDGRHGDCCYQRTRRQFHPDHPRSWARQLGSLQTHFEARSFTDTYNFPSVV